MNIVNREFNTVDNNLISGLFYYLRATISETVGAEVLLSYGLMKTGLNQYTRGRKKTGTLLLASGTAVAVHVIYSCASALQNRKN